MQATTMNIDACVLLIFQELGGVKANMYNMVHYLCSCSLVRPPSRRNEDELTRMQDVRSQRLQMLERSDHWAYKALRWLESNQHLFRKPILEPVMVSVNIVDQRCVGLWVCVCIWLCDCIHAYIDCVCVGRGRGREGEGGREGEREREREGGREGGRESHN